MSMSEQGKNVQPSGGEVSMELRPTAQWNQGCSNAAFQDEDLEEQDSPGNSTVRSRVLQSGEQGNAKQGDRQITIEEESSPGNKEDVEGDDQDDHQKGCLERKYDMICEFCRKHRIILRRIIGGILLTGFLALVIAACVLNFHRALPLFVITVVTIFFVIWDHLMAKYEHRIDEFLSPCRRLLNRHWFWLKWVMWSSLVLVVIFWLILDTARLGKQQLVSFGGLILYIVLLFLFSKHPTRILPIVVFFSTVMSVLYYVGLMQWVIRKVGWLMLVTMGSSPIESVVAAGNIFVGQVSSTHLLTASVMSAPASLAVAKLFWPETEKPKITLKNAMKIESGDSRNLLEAATQGASSSIPLVANIAVNLIAFLALLSFVNSALSWFGNMLDYPQLSFELLCSYIFMPFSFMMGVDWQDSFMVAKLIGYKTFFNEFVAYDHLSKLINLRKAAGPKFVNGVQQYMSIRSETIATYALCGFANFGSLGIVIGGLTSIAPSRKRDIASGAMRALIAGTVACFMTACIAGEITGQYNNEGTNCFITEQTRCDQPPHVPTTMCSPLYPSNCEANHTSFKLLLARCLVRAALKVTNTDGRFSEEGTSKESQ
ncbi:solute carrier family 28 member 3 [Cricetulus griseus]|nr:solute carrier family 28 member 3 [Cricetulus griseus]